MMKIYGHGKKNFIGGTPPKIKFFTFAAIGIVGAWGQTKILTATMQ